MSKATKVTPGLLPDFAVERFSNRIQKAQEKAVKAATALKDGEAKALDARADAHAAPAADAARLAEAVKAGKPAPQAQAPELERNADAAQAAVGVLRNERDRARKDLHQAIVDELPKCIEIQNGVIGEIREQAETLLGELGDVLARLALEGAVATGLRGADEYHYRRKGERRLSKLGKLSFSRVRWSTDASLEAAVKALESFAPITTTAGQQQEADEKRRAENQARHRQMKQMAGAVYVGGSE